MESLFKVKIMDKKVCSKCKEEKEVCEFNKDSSRKDGYDYNCKSCCKQKRQSIKIDREKHRERQKKYYNNNVDRIRIYKRKYENDRLKIDSEYRISKNMRRRISLFLQSTNIIKSNKTFDVIGCTPQQLKEYIQFQFQDDMSWENYGYHGWHIDHIIPLSSAKTEEEIYQLCHYTNLQPLWAEDNLKKSNKIL
jgi:hypothetical protein